MEILEIFGVDSSKSLQFFYSTGVLWEKLGNGECDLQTGQSVTRPTGTTAELDC